MALAFAAVACGSNADAGTSTGDGGAPGVDSKAVGFIFVGPKDDFGYNQAAYAGSEAVAAAFPDVEVLQAENVPETAESEAVMQGMIDDGADLIFATSYGHLEFAANLAAENPEVVRKLTEKLAAFQASLPKEPNPAFFSKAPRSKKRNATDGAE